MTIKTRVLSTPEHRHPQLYQSGVPQNAGGQILSVPLVQITDSEAHRFRGTYGGMDLGGPFSTEKAEYENSATGRFTSRSRIASQTWVDGSLSAALPTQVNLDDLKNNVDSFSNSTLDAWGTTAISQVLPTKSEAQLGVAVGELIGGGLPSIVGKSLLKSKLKDFRKVGDEYLNIEFGIKPLISDVLTTAKSIVEAEQRLAQLQRDSGRLVRRRFSFPILSEEFVGVVTGAAAVPPGWSNTYLYNSLTGTRKTTISTFTTRRWFSGAFTYHLKLSDTQQSQLENAATQARLLLGVKLDAEVLWNLSPWSWLADWFGNVGDIVTNLSHFQNDGLVMPYGYIMAQQNASRITSIENLGWFDPVMPRSVSTKLTFTRKQRRKAHPFGFGITDVMLDTRQWAILGALGISSAPRRW